MHLLIDRYIGTQGYTHSFRPEMWKWFADLPEGTWGRRSDLTETYDMRIRLALAAGDYATARQSVEDMLGFAEDCRCGVTPVRLALVQIANDEINKGQRQEPLRIIGYLSRQPLSAYHRTSRRAAKETRRRAETRRLAMDSPARLMKPQKPLTPQPKTVPTSVSSA